MFTQSFHQCPACKAEIRQRLDEETEFKCASCGRHFRVLADKETGRTGFIDLTAQTVPEPLYLPKGSIRAGVTVILSAASWVLMFRGAEVPAYVFSLLLAVIGYYFGFRKKLQNAESKIYDAGQAMSAPLFLPANVIRFFLVVGFAAACAVLASRGRLGDLQYLEFFVILFGLVVGYVFAKVSSRLKTTAPFILLNHIKGLVVIVASLTLAVLLVTGMYQGRAYFGLTLAAIVSFYFGSRS